MENQIKAYRVRNNLTQRQLAELSGTSQQHLHRIEAGLSNPSIDMANRICRALQAEPYLIFPELASASFGLKCLHPYYDDPGARTQPADWRVLILGADEQERMYLVSNAEAQRVQEGLSCYNSVTAELSARFLFFKTASRAIAVNLDLIDSIRLNKCSYGEPEDLSNADDESSVLVLRRDGINFSCSAYYGTGVATNFVNLMSTRRLPFFTVTSRPIKIDFLNTERIVLVELAVALLRVREMAAPSQSDESVPKSIKVPAEPTVLSLGLEQEE